MSPSRSGSARFTALPPPSRGSKVSLDEALARRRSFRNFSERALTERQLSQLLWATQGVTDPEGLRTAPSAGALYPLEIYVATADGLHHYRPEGHRIRSLSDTDLRPAIHRAALRQESILKAPAVFVFASVHERVEKKYGRHGRRYIHMEVGHAAQNLLLQAAALDLGAVPIGAFQDARIHRALGLPPDHRPLYLVPVGSPR